MRHKSTAEADPRHAADNVEPFVGGPSRTVGERLRNAREDLGLELRQVSETLRIRYAHLRALEEGDLRELPGQTYAVGFVRTYADYLGLDSREMVERYKEEMSGIPRSTQLVFPTPKPEGKIPGGALVLISLLLVGLAYGGWYAFNEYGDELESLIMRETPPVPLAETPQDEAPAAPAVEPSAAPEARVEPEQAAPRVPPGEAPAEPAPAGQAPAPEAPAATATAPSAAPDAAPAPSPTVAAPAVEPPAAEPPAAPTQPERTATASSSRQRTEETQGAGQSSLAPAPATGLAPGTDSATGGLPASESAREVEAPAAPLPAVPDAAAPTAAREAPALADAPADEAVRDVGPQPTAEPAPQPTAQPLPQAAREPAPQTTVAREEEIPVPPIPESAGGSQSGRSSRVFGTANTDARIVLRATADSWVQVRNARSDLLFTQVLRAGDSYNVPNEPGLTLLTGNAGGLQVLVDGRAVPPLGPSGSVRRDIELEPESLVQGAQ